MSVRNDKETALRLTGTWHARFDEVDDELFRSHEFFDPRDLLQVKYEMLRQVAIDGRGVSEVTRAFGFSRPPFYHAQEAFAQGGLAALIPKPTGPKTARKLTDEVLDYVEQLKAANRALRAPQWSEKVLEKFGLAVHPRSIQRALERRAKKDR
jgi:hypothetical protein